MKLDVYNTQNKKVGDVEVSDEVFGAEVKPHLHHTVVKYQLAKRRAGTHSTLTRAEVAGTTKKMYRQKGTGRARHGNWKSPTMPGGGRAHGPKPRDYSLKVPKKMRAGALRSVLSQKLADGKLKVVDAFELAGPKTKEAAGYLTSLGSGSALVVDVDNKNLQLSVRNLADAKFLPSEGLNVYDVLNYDNLLITQAAVQAIDGRLKS